MSLGWPGWEQQGAEPQGYRREMYFQRATGYSSETVWGLSPKHYIAFKTQIDLPPVCFAQAPHWFCADLQVWVNDNVFSKDGWNQWINFSGSTRLWFSFAVWTKGSCIPGDPAAFTVTSVFISSLKGKVCSRTDLGFWWLRGNKGWSGQMAPPESLRDWRNHC